MTPGPAPSAALPFDAVAPTYDADFTRSLLGALLGRAVRRRRAARFRAGMEVLELGCGTCEDAVYLARRGVRVVATDSSAGMVDEGRRKVERTGLGGRVEVRRMAIEALCRPGGGPPAVLDRRYDGVLSNFGGLNCVADLSAVARGLGERLRPGAPAVLCLMGPRVPWEWAWFLWRGEPRRAFRRLRRAGVVWRGMTVRYPSIARTRRSFHPWFRMRRVAAVGALLPPTYAEPWAREHPRLVARLARLERRLESVPPLPWLADHYLVELERR